MQTFYHALSLSISLHIIHHCRFCSSLSLCPKQFTNKEMMKSKTLVYFFKQTATVLKVKESEKALSIQHTHTKKRREGPNKERKRLTRRRNRGNLFSSFTVHEIPQCHPSRFVSLDTKEGIIPLIDETRETRLAAIMDICGNGIESDVEFWPIEHPIEPLEEDRPVKCPIPDSSVINDNNMHEEWYSESMRKKAELTAVTKKERKMVVTAEPPVGAVRKRQHRLTGGDHSVTTY